MILEISIHEALIKSLIYCFTLVNLHIVPHTHIVSWVSDLVHLELDLLTLPVPLCLLLCLDPVPVHGDEVEARPQEAAQVTTHNRDPEPVAGAGPHLAAPAKHPGHHPGPEVTGGVNGVPEVWSQ